jgi:hypothetical protein
MYSINKLPYTLTYWITSFSILTTLASCELVQVPNPVNADTQIACKYLRDGKPFWLALSTRPVATDEIGDVMNGKYCPKDNDTATSDAGSSFGGSFVGACLISRTNTNGNSVPVGIPLAQNPC